MSEPRAGLPAVVTHCTCETYGHCWLCRGGAETLTAIGLVESIRDTDTGVLSVWRRS